MGGVVGSTPSPAVFNTGQVILGWLRCYGETGESKYLLASERAGGFLLDMQDEDGAWRRGNSLFANPESTTYNSRVGWALILLGQATGNDRFTHAGEMSVRHAISMQAENGWFKSNSLDRPEAPVLHTVCYAIEGILGAAEALNHAQYFARAKASASSLLTCVNADGQISGRLNANWDGMVRWSCLTGCAQLAGIWLRIFSVTGETVYRDSARKVIGFLKTTQNCVSPNGGLRGGIKGSFPFDGEYGRYEILNWATKFFVDALLLDERCAEKEFLPVTQSMTVEA